MKIEYDKNSDSKYIRLKKGKISKTEKKKDWLFLDYDRNENVVGIEILDASKNLLSVLSIGGELIECNLVEFKATNQEFIKGELSTKEEGHSNTKKSLASV